MSSSLKVKLSNKNSKKPVKKLPPHLDLDLEATLQDVKQLIARQAGIRDHNRIGLFNPTTGKTFKDRNALVRNLDTVMKAEELLVRDLGPQVAWRTVFLAEYLGPIMIHLLVVYSRPLLYGRSLKPDLPMSPTQNLVFCMVMGHFLKRELETLFVHRFSSATMPVFNIFKNSIFYWALSGVLVAYFVYSPTSEAALAKNRLVDYAGLAVYLYGEISNATVHLYLASLRPKGSTVRKIPQGYGFNIVTCPNYMFEVISWLGIIAVSRSWTVVVFIAFGIWQMKQWALQKEKAYRAEFGDKYRKHRYTMLPGLF